MPTWTRRRLTPQERWIMAYVRQHPGCTVHHILMGYQTTHRQFNEAGHRIWANYMTGTGIRELIRSAQLKGAPLATTPHGVVIARGSAVHQQAMRMKIHALGELRNAAILMHTRLSDRLAGQIDAMGRDRVTVRAR